jgi:hypothetical protein
MRLGFAHFGAKAKRSDCFFQRLIGVLEEITPLLVVFAVRQIRARCSDRQLPVISLEQNRQVEKSEPCRLAFV